MNLKKHARALKTVSLGLSLSLACCEIALAFTGGLAGTKRGTGSIVANAWQAPVGNVRHNFVPNDPYLSDQWHLTNSSALPSANVVGAWGRGLTGAGVTIGIVDDGLEWTHPDLAAAYSAANSRNFGSSTLDFDPRPRWSNTAPGFGDGDNHGTAVAGVAAARGGNGVGVSGAAPGAKLAGLRADFNNQGLFATQFADATVYRSGGGAGGIHIKNHSYGISSPYINNTGEVDALTQSMAAGAIHTLSAGNERQGSGDANKRDTLNTPGAIGVAALGSDGRHSYYSNFGANIVVTAPSSGAGRAILTTDRSGLGLTAGYNDAIGTEGDGDGFSDTDYTALFGGTSSASPLVAGVLALAKEVNPNLNARMAKHLLARTSNSTIDAFDNSESSDGGWRTNAAGIRFNQNYGFGLIDADDLTLAAAQYGGVTAAAFESLSTNVGQSLPDAVINSQAPGTLIQHFDLYEDGELEELLVDLDVTHTYRGDLQATIVSPAGTSSRLMLRDINDSTNHLNWEFATNAFWGENPVGRWSLVLEDWFTQDTGRWNSFAVTAVTGSLVAVPEPNALLIATLVALAISIRSRDGREHATRILVDSGDWW